jgi:hypothetical protein
LLARVLPLRREGDIEITGVHVSDGDRSVDRGIRVCGRQPAPAAADVACARARAGSKRHRPIILAGAFDDQPKLRSSFESRFSAIESNRESGRVHRMRLRPMSVPGVQQEELSVSLR